MDQETVLNAVSTALTDVVNNDEDLLTLQAHELALVHRFGVYLEAHLQSLLRQNGLTVDLDYNRHGDLPKLLPPRPDREGDRRFRPDLIVHRRRVDTHNLLVVEWRRTPTLRYSSVFNSAFDRSRHAKASIVTMDIAWACWPTAAITGSAGVSSRGLAPSMTGSRPVRHDDNNLAAAEECLLAPLPTHSFGAGLTFRWLFGSLIDMAGHDIGSRRPTRLTCLTSRSVARPAEARYARTSASFSFAL
jgi:hypothetical protein